jgi:ferrous iron transport protein B
MVFALLTSPCIAALAAMKKELGSWKWWIFAVLYELIISYGIALMIFQLGSLSIGTLLSFLFLIVIVVFVLTTVIRVIKRKGSTCSNCSGCSTQDSCHLPKKKDF